MAKRKRYTVQARLDLLVTTEVLAESLEDAVEQTKKLGEHDFVDIPEGQYQEGSYTITGVYKA